MTSVSGPVAGLEISEETRWKVPSTGPPNVLSLLAPQMTPS